MWGSVPRGLSGNRKALFWIVIAGVILAGVLFFGRAIWRATATINDARRQTAQAGRVPFRLTILSPHPSRFERPLSPASFRSAVEFDGGLFVSGPSGLLRYDSNGQAKGQWYPGAELPPAPLTALAVRRGTAAPELWIATDGAGIVIYDGQSFRQLLPSPPALRHVTALLPLPNGSVLVGTPGAGVFVTDTKQFAPLHSQFSAAEVTTLAADDDAIWIGTRRNGLWLWRGGEATQFAKELPDLQVLSLFADAGHAWAGTPLGVAEFENGRFVRRLAYGIFAQSLAKTGGGLLIGTMDQGTVRVALGSGGNRAARDESSPGPPILTEGTKPVVAFASFGQDLLAISPDSIRRTVPDDTSSTVPPNSLASGHITALEFDKKGRLWIGYFDRGVDLVEEGTAARVQHREDDVLFCVNRIKADPERGNVAVATANGLVLFDASGTARHIVTTKNGSLNNHITDVLWEAQPNRGLVAATPAGISFLDGVAPSGISAFQGLVNNHAYTVAEFNGGIVAGTLGGFSLLRNGLVEASYTTANSGLRQNWITASASDGDSVYLGTYGSGVVRFDRTRNLSRFRDFERGRVEINPNAMITTPSAIYAGTNGQGLAILQHGQDRWQFVSDGLPSANVTALAAHDGVLYIGTDNGLVRSGEQRFRP
jgi:ligand-binding sensor domain-containing protein